MYFLVATPIKPSVIRPRKECGQHTFPRDPSLAANQSVLGGSLRVSQWGAEKGDNLHESEGNGDGSQWMHRVTCSDGTNDEHRSPNGEGNTGE